MSIYIITPTGIHITSLPYREVEAEEEDSGEKNEETEEKEQIINADQIFKSEECVICLTNPPNVLFCNCGHLCICEECDKTKSLKNCPICKTESKIKRIIN